MILSKTDTPPTEEPEDCDCCHFDGMPLKWYRPNLMARQKEGKWLCNLCASTMTGTYYDYPEQHDGDSLTLMKTVCYVGNAILLAVKWKES